MNKLTLKDLPLKEKKVLMRVDFNVPLKEDGSIEDDTRIRESLPSIRYVLEHGAHLILMSHLGRPKGKPDPKYSLKVCAERLEKLLKKPVSLASDPSNVPSQEIVLLENLRFDPAEEEPEKDPSFAKKLASLGDFYVNDAFGTAHRAHSSTATITKYFPGKAAMGFLMEKELSFLEPLIKNPKRPFYALIGGAKVSSKIGVLKSLLGRLDALFIGGGMAYTFFKAQGMKIGTSICEDDHLKHAQELMQLCREKKIPLFFPKDVVVRDASGHAKTLPVEKGIPDGWEGVDIGQETVSEWTARLQKAKTIFWNGPVGIFEIPQFAKGTEALAVALSKFPSIRIVGGGDSVAAINALKLSEYFTHLSTGGGAALEFLELGTLPGIEVLSEKKL